MNHHVTEAIGDMYGDDDFGDGKQEARPLSFVSSPLGENVEVSSYFDPTNSNSPRSPIRSHTTPNGGNGQKSHTMPMSVQSQHSDLNTGPLSPTLSLRSRSGSDTATSQFPLNDIDYESNPAAVQKEMHNLQALRRMSMDVGSSGDPDLPSFQGKSLMPSVAPTGDDDEDDPSRLFWVPARVHPELAPMEFKTFLENRVQTIKRRSGDSSSLSPEAIERSNSGAGSLRRKKSMLSRQIDNSGGRGAVGYKDGAEQIERKKSQSKHQSPEIGLSDLQELDELVRDPSKTMQKLSLDTNMRDSGVEVSGVDDRPILPQAPGAMGLRRSTHTTYRRGSLRRGERVPFSQRAKQRAEAEGEEAVSPSSPTGSVLTRVQSETATNNFSRPGRARRGMQAQQTSPSSSTFPDAVIDSDSLSIRSAPGDSIGSSVSNAYSQRKAPLTQNEIPVPRIVETPPPPEEQEQKLSPEVTQPAKSQARQQSNQQEPGYPARSSSQAPRPTSQPVPVPEEPPVRSSRRPPLGRQQSSAQGVPKVSTGQTLNQMAQQPSPLMANNSRTDSLTFIPTLQEDKKSDKKSKKEEPEAPRKTSWGWFKGGEEKEKKSKKEDESKKNKKGTVGTSDNTRLDLLQQSIDQSGSPQGRESLVIDRDSIDPRLADERKRESTRKSGDGKKEKDGIFSSLFGGGKKKGERDVNSKKANSLRALSPEPPHRVLKPDIDYSWTRFSILEERAIYRMAHIKLANPRRALYSQVLLSNFMYSYLAKVQQMHPHVQIPQSAQQKKQQEAERRQKELEAQQAAQQVEQQYKYDYHQVRGSAHYVYVDSTNQQVRGLPSMQIQRNLTITIPLSKAQTMSMMPRYTTETIKMTIASAQIEVTRDLCSTLLELDLQARRLITVGKEVRVTIHTGLSKIQIMRTMTTKCGR